MPGAAGACAIRTATNSIVTDWLQGASGKLALVVLTQELGHYLDGLLNRSNTAGDEGQLFAALLHRDGVISIQEQERLLAENDPGIDLFNDIALAVEQATVISTPSIGGEAINGVAFAALKANGSVVTWGESNFGGNSSGVADQTDFHYGILYADMFPVGSAGIPPNLLMQDMLHFLPPYLQKLYKQHRRGEEDQLIQLGITFQRSMYNVTSAMSRPCAVPCSTPR